MVCRRCIAVVKDQLETIGIPYFSVEIGEVIIDKPLTPVLQSKLTGALQSFGFELINGQKYTLIEKLKKTIEEIEHYSDEDLKISYSDYIKLMVEDNFISLNTLFSEIEGITIDKHIIEHKIEMVKELLLHHDLKLTEIAILMHYSNIAQLSRQFKTITGLTPLHFRQLQHSDRVIPGDN
jgi:YesN/AraC family two-component response regulator